MNKDQDGQVVIVVAVLLMIVLTMMALLVDGGRLLREKQELKRAADAAGKAALISVADEMVSRAVDAMTATAQPAETPHPDPTTSGPSGSSSTTPTPGPVDLMRWLSEEDLEVLVSSPLRTTVANRVHDHLEINQFGLSNPRITEIEVMYPYRYHPQDRDLLVLVRVRRKIKVIFGSLLMPEEGVITCESRQSLPLR